MNQTPRFPSLFDRQRLNAVGILMLLGVLLYLLFPIYYGYLLVPLAFAFFVGAIFLKGEKRTVFLCFGLGLSLALISTSLCTMRQEKGEKLCGKEVLAQGYVLSVGEGEYDLSLISLDENSCRLRVRCEGEAPPQGSKISAKILVLDSYSKDTRSDGIAFKALVKEYSVCGKSYVLSFIGSLRKSILSSFGKGETGGFLSAILLGERTNLSGEVKEAFRTTASSHILAISGLHVTQLIAFFFCFSRIFSLNIRLVRVILYPLVLFFFLMAGSGVSVFRAAVMTLFATTGILLRRRSDSVTALVFSAILLVFPDPFAMENLSFVFSYFSTFALLVCGVPLSCTLSDRLQAKGKKNFLSKSLVTVVASFCISSSVFVFMLPLQLLFFGEVQAFSPLYSLILVPLFQPVLITALFLAVLSFFPFLFSILSPVLWKIPCCFLILVKLLAVASPPLISLGVFSVFVAGLTMVLLLFFLAKRTPLYLIFYIHLFCFILLGICSFFA